MRAFITFVILAISITAANAAPKAQRGSEKLCTDYDEVYEGVWFDHSGKEVVLWRVGRTGRKGCYAWLNAYTPWNIEGAGGYFSKVRKRGNTLVSYFNGNERLIMKNDFSAEYHLLGVFSPGTYEKVK